MSLDAVLLVDGEPSDLYVSFSPEEHWSLIAAAKVLGLKTILSFAEYYGEATIPVDQSSKLESELCEVIHAIDDGDKVPQVFSELILLCQRARELNIDVSFIPD